MFFYLLFVFKIKYDLVKDCFLYLFSVKAFLFHCLWKKIPFTYTKNVSKSVRNLQQLNKKVLEMWPNESKVHSKDDWQWKCTNKQFTISNL